MYAEENNEILNAIQNVGRSDNFYLLKKQIHGFELWPVFRINLAFSFISLRYSGISKKNNKQRLYFTKKRIENKHTGTYVLLHSEDVYKVGFNGSVFDRVFESRPNEYDKGTPLEINFDSVSETIHANYFIIGVIPKLFIRFLSCFCCIFMPRLLMELYRSVAKVKSNVSKQNINCLTETLRLAGVVNNVWLLSLYLQLQLRKIKLSHYSTPNFYRHESMAATLLAKKRGLLSLNYQHGVQSDLHPAFFDWEWFPENGYMLLPSKFLCWGEDPASLINNWSGAKNLSGVFKPHSAAVIENKWLKKFDFVDTKRPATFSDLFTVCVTSQPSLGLLEPILLDVIGRTQKKIRWLVRLHPRQYSNMNFHRLLGYSEFFELSSLKFANENPLPLVLKNSNLHVTGFSSSAYEARDLNITTIFTNRLAYSYYSEVIEGGFGQVILEPDALITELIKRARGLKHA